MKFISSTILHANCLITTRMEGYQMQEGVTERAVNCDVQKSLECLHMYHKIRARERKMSLVYKTTKSFPEYLYTYQRRFERACDCIMANAIKYGNESSLIEIWLRDEPAKKQI